MRILAVGSMLLCGAARGQEELRIFPGSLDGGEPGDMMKRYLLKKVDDAQTVWRADYEQRKTPEAIAAYQKRMREHLIAVVGGFPERTPLNAQVTGTVQCDGYRAEKLIFESLPNFYVTGTVFVPDASRHAPPYAGVLVPCGHSAVGKAADAYQSMGASLAYHGMVALVFDPLDQGERAQWLDANEKPPIWGVLAHTMVGIGSMLLGQNTARYEIWDGMRALDYLTSRPDVDPARIGCTGNSGGGTQTSYLMALDDRIKAAAPSCYLHTMAYQLRDQTGDAEQNTFGQLAFGMDMPDFVMMRAPMPVKMLTATYDYFKIEGAWECFRYAKRLYSRQGYSERVDILENDARHNYNQLQREAGVRWLARWLQERDEALVEPALKLISPADLNSTPKGQVMLLPGARSAYDLNIETEEALAKQRRHLWTKTPHNEMQAKVRELAGIRALGDLPEPKVEKMGTLPRSGYVIEKLLLQPEHGIYLPALMLTPDKCMESPVLFLNGKGMQAAAAPGGLLEQVASQGRIVLAVDVRGLGETEQKKQNMDQFGAPIGFDWEDCYKAYVLGLSYVGMRAEDALTAARFLKASTGASNVDLIAVGAVGVPALHAAALEPELFGKVCLEDTLISWSSLVHGRQHVQQFSNAVHAALTTYDLPDLASTLGDRLTLVRSLDAQGHEAVAPGG